MPELHQSGSPELRQQQQLSARQLQALEVLQLPAQELDSLLSAELDANPMLEFAPEEEDPVPPADPPKDEADEIEREWEAEQTEHTSPEFSDDPWQNGDSDGDEYDAFDLPARTGSGEDAGNYRNDAVAAAPDLEEQLALELRNSSATPRLRELALLLLEQLNDNGFLTTPLADLAMSCDAELPELEQALHLLQRIAPAGTAARNLEECLRLQLERRGQMTPLLDKLLSGNLALLAGPVTASLAKKLGTTPEELADAVRLLRTLDRHPGALHERESSVVDPELEIICDNPGEAEPHFSVRLIKERSRRVVISRKYEKLLDDPTQPPETRKFILDRLGRARDLIRALEQRSSTLERIGGLIVREQRDYLLHGIEALHPLTMKQAGAMLELHESTVSRAAAGKFIRTPQGVQPLKFFFPGGLSGSDGSGVSTGAVQEKLRELIDLEDPAHPLSDEALAKMLQRDGINIARRTVMKYREAMQIPNSHARIR